MSDTPTTPPPSTLSESDMVLMTSPVPDPQATTPSPSAAILNPRAQLLLNRLQAGNQQREQQIVENHVQLVEVSKVEMQAAIEAHPDHPVAAVYANAIANLKDGGRVAVEQPDLQALLENRQVETVESTRPDGVAIRTKRVV